MMEQLYKYVYRYRNPTFKNHIPKLLEEIKKVPAFSLNEQQIKLSHTDWFTEETKAMKRDYQKYFVDNILKEFGPAFCKYNTFHEIKISNIWFQIYNKGDYHAIHTHPNCNFTNVFYLKVAPFQYTSVYDVHTNQKLECAVQPGDILSQPAFLKHESSTNAREEQKIVISFNSNINQRGYL
jgi:hypothetical protein